MRIKSFFCRNFDVVFAVLLLGLGGLYLGYSHEINSALNNSTIRADRKIIDITSGQFLVDEDVAASLDISSRVRNAPLLSELRINDSARWSGRWTFINYDGKTLLERTTPFAFGLYKVEYYQVDSLVVFFTEQSFMCEATPMSLSPARDGFVGSTLIVDDKTDDGRIDFVVIFRHFVPNNPAESSADLEPACPIE